MRVIKANYSEFVKSVKVIKGWAVRQGWNVVIDLDDGEISVKHNSNMGSNCLVLEHGHNIDSDFDDSDENIDGTYGTDFVKNSVENSTYGEIEVEMVD